MPKKAIIAIDLASLAGSMRFRPGVQLPRHDKRLLERCVSSILLQSIAANNGTFSELESSALDPPDVTFAFNGETVGMELVELVPVNRLETEAIVRQLRIKIGSCIQLGPHSKDWVVNIFLHDDYAKRLRPGPIHSQIADQLNQFFASSKSHENTEFPHSIKLTVPERLQSIVHAICCYRVDLTGDTRINNRNEPLIIFGAQSTMIVPEDDCPAIVESQLSRKAMHDVGNATWLLIWSNHYSLESCRDELNRAITDYLNTFPLKYSRIFHLHLFAGSTATEFPRPK